jgi:hypothetical protein
MLVQVGLCTGRPLRGPMESSTSTDALARFGHALSDPTRTRVLLTLIVAPANPSDLADRLEVLVSPCLTTPRASRAAGWWSPSRMAGGPGTSWRMRGSDGR